MSRYRVYTTGMLKYFDFDDEAETVVDLYERVQAKGYLTATMQDEERVREVVVPLRAITLITEADE